MCSGVVKVSGLRNAVGRAATRSPRRPKRWGSSGYRGRQQTLAGRGCAEGSTNSWTRWSASCPVCFTPGTSTIRTSDLALYDASLDPPKRRVPLAQRPRVLPHRPVFTFSLAGNRTAVLHPGMSQISLIFR